jgi:hypothetical protein
LEIPDNPSFFWTAKRTKQEKLPAYGSKARHFSKPLLQATPRGLVRQAFRSGFSYATAASLPPPLPIRPDEESDILSEKKNCLGIESKHSEIELST